MNNDTDRVEWFVYFVILPILAGAIFSAIVLTFWYEFSDNSQSCHLRLRTADANTITIIAKVGDDTAPDQGDGRRDKSEKILFLIGCELIISSF